MKDNNTTDYLIIVSMQVLAFDDNLHAELEKMLKQQLLIVEYFVLKKTVST
jgi:hypothetical protein